MLFHITGRILDETGTGIAGVEVHAYDQDVGADDDLGASVTDAAGAFEITYTERQFQEFPNYEAAPDVYITVKTQDGRRVYTSPVMQDAPQELDLGEIRVLRRLVEGAPSGIVGFAFSERMAGYYAEAIPRDHWKLPEETRESRRQHCTRLADVGRRRNDRLSFRVRISIDDLQTFLDDPAHTARLEGRIDYGALGANLPIKDGIFNLFSMDPEAKMRKMLYRFSFITDSGQVYCLDGEKEIHREHTLLEGFPDMTALFTIIHHGPTIRGKEAGAGVLKVPLDTLIEMARSTEVLGAANTLEEVGARARFLGFVSRELLHTYL